MREITIDAANRLIGSENVPYVIAEIGSNHNQDFELAKQLIHVSAQCGADAVKFQSLNLKKQYHISKRDIKQKELFKQIELQESWYPLLAVEAEKAGVSFCSAPTYLESLPLLEAVQVPFYKIGSPQIKTFPSIIKKVAALGKPVILSVGYCNYAEIERAVAICESVGNKQILLLHCVSEYPTRFEQVNLKTIQTLQNMFGYLVGLSDHTPGHEVPCAAVALGAVMVEKHITLDRNMKGPDHAFALEPDEFKAMVSAVKNVYLALGSSRKQVTRHENNFSRELVVRWIAKRNIRAGELITEKNIIWLRADEGITDDSYQLLGTLRASSDIAKGLPVTWSSVELEDSRTKGELS